MYFTISGISCGYLPSSMERDIKGNHTVWGKDKKKSIHPQEINILLLRKLELKNWDVNDIDK